jgi:outer membrane lipoprotein carrier protein
MSRCAECQRMGVVPQLPEVVVLLSSWIHAVVATLQLGGADAEPVTSSADTPVWVAQADATPAPAPAATDAKLDELLDAIQATYDGTTSFRASFVQKYTVTMLRRTQESSGNIAFEKPGKMRWEYAAPSLKSFVVDGKMLWVVQPEDHTAFVNACFQQDGLTASVAFLFGQGKIREQFDVAWFTGTFGAATDHHLVLTPKTPNSVYAKLILVVDPQTKRVAQSIVVDPAGNVNQFIYKDAVFNGKVQKGAFTPKIPKDITLQRMPGTCNDPVAGLP